ncbi:MAG: DUF4118 domain-containing protein [Chloroflexi bacterium]|nr:DUF4118 domain-containing protein [Chloroflexota bacterium]
MLGGRVRVEAWDLRGPPGVIFALFLSVASVGAKWAMLQAGLGDPGFIVYIPAIALAAWLGGGGAGMLATIVCAAGNDYMFIGPAGSLLPSRSDDLTRLIIFLGAGILISGISSRLRHSIISETRAHEALTAALSAEQGSRTRAVDLARRLSDATGELRRSSDQLTAVIETVTEAIILQGPDGALLYANEEAARINGFSSVAELLTVSSRQLALRADMRDEQGQPIDIQDLPSSRALRGEPAPERLIRPAGGAGGDRRWVAARAAAVTDESGVVRFAVTIFRDITAQHRAEEGQRFLADATALLSATRDVLGITEGLAALAIDSLADWCAVDILRADGSGIDSVLAQADPTGGNDGHAARRTIPFDPSAGSGSAAVIHSGRPVLMVDVAPQTFEDGAMEPSLRDSLRALGLRSYLCAPLVAGGRAIGAISLATTESRRLDQPDLEVVVELGRRAGTALENVQLYRAADARQAELAAILASLRDAVVVYDAQGLLQLRNPAADDLIGSASLETLEQLTALLGVTRDEWADDTRGDQEGGWPEVRLPNGRWIELSGSNASGSTIMLARDVTARRAAQAAREAFIGLLSHELRTPITTIYGGTRLLDRPLAEAKRMELVHDIRAEAERLYRLVEDLLVMTRVERGGVDIGHEPILLQRLIGDVVRVEEARWPGLSVRLQLSERLPTVRGDPTYVEQVVRNLITNAAKYGGTDAPVDVAVEDHGNEVWVRVSDRGPGIVGEESEQLFDLFYRGSSTAATVGGAGIGLFVCRALVTAMSGRLWAGPRIGGGAEFGFSLPVLESEEEA